MGVYIKNMEMPETCKSCYLSKFDPGLYAYVCQPTGILIDYDMAKNKRLRVTCPLVPISPHGRLGDLEYEELIKQCRDCIDCLCGECKYEHLQKPGNFVPCMNALLGECANAIEELICEVADEHNARLDAASRAT